MLGAAWCCCNCPRCSQSDCFWSIHLDVQATEWTYEQLAVNLLDFKDSKALLDQLRPRAALHDEYGKSEEQDTAILADMHTACLATCASWFA